MDKMHFRKSKNIFLFENELLQCLKNAKIYYSLTMNYCNVINETFLVRSKYVSVGSQRDQRSQIEKLEVSIFAPKIRQQVRPISLAHKVYLSKKSRTKWQQNSAEVITFRMRCFGNVV